MSTFFGGTNQSCQIEDYLSSMVDDDSNFYLTSSNRREENNTNERRRGRNQSVQRTETNVVLEQIQWPVRYSSLSKYEVRFSDLDFYGPLGSGAFSDVYLGRYQQKPCAIKKLRNPFCPTTQRNFMRELQNLSISCHHSNIVSLIGYTITPQLCIILDYCPGGTLSSLLHNGGAASSSQKTSRLHESLLLRDALTIALHVARACEFLHAKDIIHRDITSENILLASNGSVCLADFGVSRNLTDEPAPNLTVVVQPTTLKKLTPTGHPRFRAPEVTLMLPYTKAADVFSFGVCLWELLTLKKPYAGLSAREAAEKCARGFRLPTNSPHIPLTLKHLLDECLSFDVSKRPTFGDIVQRLTAMLNLIKFAEKTFSKRKQPSFGKTKKQMFETTSKNNHQRKRQKTKHTSSLLVK